MQEMCFCDKIIGLSLMYYRKGTIILRKIIRIFLMITCLCLLFICRSDLVPYASAASAMTASESCVEFIKQVEGFSPQPYYDYNQYTVGYGTKCPTEKYFDYTANGIPRDEADALLQEFLTDIASDINSKLIDKYQLTLSQHQFDALVSFSFNIGTGWMTYDSTLRSAILNNADDNGIVYAFGLYCTAGGKYLPGLITRRLCEANIYLNGVYHQNISDAYGYVYYDSNGGSLTYRVQGYVCDNDTVPAADAMRNGDSFLGWYTDLTGGSQVTVLDRSVRGKTLFARWQSAENTENLNTESTQVRVTGDIVNIRSGPSTNYSVVRKAYQNEFLTVSYITNLTTMRWGKIQDGWICLDYTNYDAVISGNADTENSDSSENIDNPEDSSNPDTEHTPENRDFVTGIVKVNDALRIRSGPGTTYSVAGFLFNGKEVDILEFETVGSTVWGRISNGWVCMDYIITDEPYTDSTVEPDVEHKQEEVPEEKNDNTFTGSESTEIKGIITADALRIRSGAGTDNRIIGFYYRNDSVFVFEKMLVDSVYWGRTDKGWINLDYIAANSSEEPPSAPETSGTMRVIADCLRVRKAIGTDQRIAQLLYYGDTVVVFETKTVDGTLWGRVDKGWICMDYVE